MNRLSTLVWMVVIVVAVFMLYKVKYEVMSLKNEVASTSHQLEQEKQAMHVVAAEWAYLNRPARLQKLAAKYLSSTDVTVSQIADIQALPFPDQSMAANDNEEAASVKPVVARMRRKAE